MSDEMDCDVCAGTGKPVSGLPCICGGTGSNIDEKAGLRRKVHEMELQVGEMEKLIKRVDDYFCKPEFGLYDSAAVLIVPPDLAMAVRTIAEKRNDECHALLMQPGPIKKCGLKAGHDGGCAEVLDDKRKDVVVAKGCCFHQKDPVFCWCECHPTKGLQS